MNRSDVIAAIVGRVGLDADQVGQVLDALTEVTAEAVGQGDPVKLPGFLTVDRTLRSARTARNPRSGEIIDVPAKFAAKVTAGVALRRAAESTQPG